VDLTHDTFISTGPELHTPVLHSSTDVSEPLHSSCLLGIDSLQAVAISSGIVPLTYNENGGLKFRNTLSCQLINNKQYNMFIISEDLK